MYCGVAILGVLVICGLIYEYLVKKYLHRKLGLNYQLLKAIGVKLVAGKTNFDKLNLITVKTAVKNVKLIYYTVLRVCRVVICFW